MTFEDQLTQAFETLTERLRGEIDAEVRRRVADRGASVPAAASAAASVSAPAPAGDVEARERLADGFETIDRARSLTDVLDALVTFARRESPRAELWLIRGGRPHLWRAPGSGADEDVPPPGQDDGMPLTIAGTAVARLTAEIGTQNPEFRTGNVALLTRYAGRSLEALTAFKTARALTQHDNADFGLRTAEADASEEDTSARRYARLLVSEIKLYHEAAVLDGRRDRDLLSRLGGEITRARVMYEQRVPAHVRERADYFQDELVRTLANGDASLLQLT